MKKTLFRMLFLALCAAMVCALPAFAAEAEEGNAPVKAPAYAAPARVWGQVTKLEGGSLQLENDNPDDPFQGIILHVEDARILDAVSGMPLDRELKDGETVYAWAGPAMTLSLPPQAAALVVVANIPADFAAPQYYEIAQVDRQYGEPAEGDDAPVLKAVAVTTTSGETLTVTEAATLFPYLTRQMVYLDSLVPGSRILVWSGAQGGVEKVMLFAYAYRGYLSWTAEGQVSVNGEALPAAGKTVDGEVLLPLRAVAEAAGYTVGWVSGQGAVVSYGGETVLSVLPGQDTVQTAQGEWGLTVDCQVENGVTYLPAAALPHLLNLFPVY